MLHHRSTPEPGSGLLPTSFFTAIWEEFMTPERFAIVNAGVLDGSGAPLRHADVAVENGRIRIPQEELFVSDWIVSRLFPA